MAAKDEDEDEMTLLDRTRTGTFNLI